MHTKQYSVYMLTNRNRSVLYIGVTSDLVRRVWEHKHDVVKGFTQKYKVHHLVFYEIGEDPFSAIGREKQLKSWSRKRKEMLVYQMNPEWMDLYDSIIA